MKRPFAPRSAAGQWMADNGHSWGGGKSAPAGQKAKLASTKTKRTRRSKQIGSTGAFKSILDFVKANRASDEAECIFVPGAQSDVPAKVEHLGRQISAASYMALLTFGTPKSEGMVVRHLCGNGHLSCVNPKHLAWGAPSDNIADATQHRALGDDATEQDRLHAVTPNR